MGAPWWFDSPGAWDQLVISGTPTPGVARIKGKIAQKLDNKRPKGKTGSTYTFNGYEPAKFTVVIRIWEKAHFEALPSLIQRIRPRAGVAPSALDVSHPVLDLCAIRSMYVEEIGLLEEAGEKGFYQLELSCLEFLPLKGKKTDTKKVEPDIRQSDNSVATLSNQDPVPRRRPPSSVKPKP